MYCSRDYKSTTFADSGNLNKFEVSNIRKINNRNKTFLFVIYRLKEVGLKKIIQLEVFVKKGTSVFSYFNRQRPKGNFFFNSLVEETESQKISLTKPPAALPLDSNEHVYAKILIKDQANTTQRKTQHYFSCQACCYQA